MDSLYHYILRIMIAAFICCMVMGLSREGRVHDILKLICGAFMLILLISPMIRLHKNDIISFSSQYYAGNAAQAISAGEDYVKNTTTDIIREQCETYILNKAAEIGADISVRITLSEEDPPIPVAVTVSGKVSPYFKLLLEEIILNDLGITKENQLWTG